MRNLGAIFIQQGRLSEGESHSQRALAVAPGMAEAQRNLAILHLLQGDFARGWAEYEARWRCGDLTLPDYEQPMWNGESIQGRTILLRCEQGLGDTLQFIRYAKLLKKRGARVLAAVQSVLLPILRDVEGVDQWIDSEQPLPEFDVYAPLLSLPRAFDRNLNNVLADVPYLSADPQRVKSWSQRLDGEGLRIAIAWQGSRDHKTDYLRSLPLAALRPLAEIPGVRLISVQKGDGQEQLEDVGFPVAAFDDLDGDGAFLDTAALLTNVDLIVSTDSAIGHLAGALARPTWLALALTPDWRWLLDREDSVWYPQTRLFRQTAIRDWDGVVEQMATALRAHLDGAEPLIARNE
jgi:hypothetical protein